jgi:hypothetical protein
MTIDWVWIGNWIQWTPPTLNYNSLWRCRQFTHSTVHYSTHWVISVCCLFTSPLATASNGGLSPSSGFPNCPRASATPTLDRQWTQLELNSKSPLTQQSDYRHQLNSSSSRSWSWSLFTIDGQSASLSWCRTPTWNPWPDFFFLSANCPLWRKDGSVIYL